MAIYHQTPKGALLGGRPEEGDIIRGSRQGTVSSVAGANRITPRPEDGGIPPILPPQPDNVAGSLSGNAKAQSLGENLWEGEAFAEQRSLKRQVGASPVPTPGSEFDEYGGMFSQPLAQSGEIREANKQRRQDRRQRVKDIKAAGGPENYSADGYHVGEYDKKGRNIQYPEKRYSKKNPPPLNQGTKYTYKKNDLMGQVDFEESSFNSSRTGESVSYPNIHTRDYSDVQEDEKSQYMTSLGSNEYFNDPKRPTSSTHDDFVGNIVERDTIRPNTGKKFISSFLPDAKNRSEAYKKYNKKR